MFTYQVDDDISLKMPHLADAEALYKVTNHSRQDLREWLPWLDNVTNVEQTKRFIRSWLTGYTENKSMMALLLCNGEIAGAAGYNQLDWQTRTVFLEYWLSKDYQGRGIITKVVQSLTDYAFSTLKFNQVEIRAAEDNKKSRNIPERLGFTYLGKIEKAEWLYDHYVDHAVYGIHAHKWNKTTSAWH